jgi:hypothetical protein
VPENIKNSLRGISDLQGNPVRDLSVYKSEWEKSFEFKLVPVDKLSKSEMTVFGQRKGFSFWGCLYLYYGGFDPRIPRFTPPSPPSRGIQKQGT